jgi:hypothetical protein
VLAELARFGAWLSGAPLVAARRPGPYWTQALRRLVDNSTRVPAPVPSSHSRQGVFMQSKRMLREYRRSLWRLAGATIVLAACQDRTAPIVDESPEQVTEFTLTPEGAVAAQGAKTVGMHKLPIVSLRTVAQAAFSAPPTTNSPFDLTFFGGAVVKSATSYNVFVNCAGNAAQCWGTGSRSPTTFLTDLDRSDFIRLANEYIGTDAKRHFPAGTPLKTTATFSSPNKASLNDIFNILFDAVNASGGASGYTAIYHVFLTQGTSMCISDGVCYSPDDPPSWVFCAFHGSVDFSPTQHVLFSVEPYQAVDGCQIPGQTPHGVIDATSSTLSHELIETITDPDGDAWFNGLFGMEVADICSAFGTNQTLTLHDYFIQSEYSNKLHACSNTAPA